MSEREQLEQAITHMETQRAILGDAVVDATIATLREKLAALETRPALEQRKQITVLFADASGFTAMSERMDAEEVRDTMNALWTGLDGAITAHGGLIDKHIGDAVMGLFGAPTAHEDDPERAIRAALAMQIELAAFCEARDATLAMRIGIHTGPVLLGEVGTTAEYTAMGDTVNLASRLEHAAPVGGILISHDTYRHVRGVFDVQALEPISVKGKTEPIQVYVVQRARRRAFRVTTRGVEGVETRMVGREAELVRLQEGQRAVMETGQARVITVVGDAGVGKSRLLHEFTKGISLLSEAVLPFRGRATQQMQDLPYSLIRDLFVRRFEIRDSDHATMAREKLEAGIVSIMGEEGVEQAHFIGQLFGFDFSASPYLRGIVNDARQIYDRAFHYVAQFFTIVTFPLSAEAGGAVVLFLDDIHWADDGSLDLVNHLVQECRFVPLLIVALARPTLFERRPSWGERVELYTRLDLHPLSKQQSHHLVDEILRKVEEIPPGLRDLIVEGAEGNPFYVEELIKMLVEDQVIVKGADRWQVEMEQLAKVRVPSTLTGVLQARLDGLPSPERGTLQQASVVGRVFWSSAVARIRTFAQEQAVEIDAPEASVTLQALHGRELVFRRDTSAMADTSEYIFKHAILRDVTYESVLKRLRRVYHAQVAAWLIEQSGERVREYAGLIGEHYERAGQETQAAEWYGRAGRQAQDTYALETAVGYYKKALALEERWLWRQGQVKVLHILGRRDDEQVALRAFEAAPGAPAFEVAYLWGQYYEALGEYAQAQAAVERALAVCQDRGDVVDQIRCLAQLGLIARRLGDYDDAAAWYDQALTPLQDQDDFRDEEARALAQILNGRGIVYRQQGDFDQARACHEWALALSRTSGDRRSEAEVLTNLGGTLFYQGDAGEALAYHRQALEIRQAIGDRAGEGTSLYNLAVGTIDLGDYDQAQEYLLAALVIQRAVGNRWEEGNILNALGFLYWQLGDLTQARTFLEQGRELSQEIGDEAGEAYLLLSLGLVACDGRELAVAEKHLTEGLTLARKQDDKRLVASSLSYLGAVSLQKTELERAIEQATSALLLRQEVDVRLDTADDLATLAAAHLAAGDEARALDFAKQTLTILEECGGEGPVLPQRDYLLCYRVLTSAGQGERARAALQSAYDLVMARADRIGDPDLRQSFLERVPANREIVQEFVKLAT